MFIDHTPPCTLSSIDFASHSEADRFCSNQLNPWWILNTDMTVAKFLLICK